MDRNDLPPAAIAYSPEDAATVTGRSRSRIFDAIKRAGSNGIMIEDINAICFDGRASAVNVRNHIHQINDALAGTDFEIRGGAPGMVGYFHIVKRHWSAVP